MYGGRVDEGVGGDTRITAGGRAAAGGAGERPVVIKKSWTRR